MKTVNIATLRRIKELSKRTHYTYRHIQVVLEKEGYGKPALSFIYRYLKKISNEKKKANNQTAKRSR